MRKRNPPKNPGWTHVLAKHLSSLVCFTTEAVNLSWVDNTMGKGQLSTKHEPHKRTMIYKTWAPLKSVQKENQSSTKHHIHN